MKPDLEKQAVLSLSGVPKSTFKERILDFLDYHFGSWKLYLYSYPMPDGLWDNRKLRVKASGVHVNRRPRLEPIADRIVLIMQQQPSM